MKNVEYLGLIDWNINAGGVIFEPVCCVVLDNNNKIFLELKSDSKSWNRLNNVSFNESCINVHSEEELNQQFINCRKPRKQREKYNYFYRQSTKNILNDDIIKNVADVFEYIKKEDWNKIERKDLIIKNILGLINLLKEDQKDNIKINRKLEFIKNKFKLNLDSYALYELLK